MEQLRFHLLMLVCEWDFQPLYAFKEIGQRMVATKLVFKSMKVTTLTHSDLFISFKHCSPFSSLIFGKSGGELVNEQWWQWDCLLCAKTTLQTIKKETTVR